MNVHVTICNNLLTGCLIKKLQAFIKKTDGAEYSLISTVFFFFIFRAVGCIFGELLNNSPLFPVSETSYTFLNILLYMLISYKKILLSEIENIFD